MEQKTSCVLIADTRERHVLRHEKELEGVSKEVKQITTGDYVVLAPAGNILAVIERKSLEDFAASLKDGRADNKKKLVELRSQVGCRIVYIIEGPEFPSPNDYFGNIPYRFIESSIFHLMIRDGITIIRTKDSLDTAKTLSRFVNSMDSLCRKMEEPDGEMTTEPVPLATILGNDIAPVSRDDVISMLTRRHDKSDHEVARELWSCFPGISVESANEYMKYWTVADIVCGRVQREKIVNFKLASGKKIGKKAMDSLVSVAKIVEVRLLQSIPGISHAAAVQITDKTPLKNLLSYNAGAIAIQNIGKAGRKLGDKLAEKILKYFNYKYIPTVQNIVVNDLQPITIAEPTIAEPTIAEPTIAEPTIADPTIAALLDNLAI